jgi:hypothetical protein
MSLRYRNRLTGAEEAAPEAPQLLGLWQVVTEGPGSFLNTVPLSSGDFLVPDVQGNWSLLDGGSGQGRSGAFGRHQLAGDLEAHSLRVMSERLQALITQGGGWLEWSEETPVVPEMSDKVELQRLDRAIAEHLGALEQVCRKPRAHLRVDIERMPVSRARRVPTSAARYLAAHSEDWERRVLRSVQPKRILALVRDDLFDIYENRVAARLVDHLLRYVRGRIEDVRKLSRMFARTRDYEKQALAGSHWRQKRVCGLWGRTLDLDERLQKAEATLEELERLRYKLLGLMDTPLYGGVPRKAQVSDVLILTNILSNDVHYRRVAMLWREWFEDERKRTFSPREVYRRQQELCHGFSAFCVLLVIRALEQLGYMPREEEAPLQPGMRLELKGPGGTATLRWEPEGVLTLSTDLGSRLRLVPLLAFISASPDEAAVRQHLVTLERMLPEGMESTLVLYPAHTAEKKEPLSREVRQRLNTLGNDLKKSARQGPGMLPVAPWDIGSVERVVRALRWTLSASRFLSYPPEVTAPPTRGLSLSQASDWLEQSGGKWRVIRPPAPHERELLGVDKAVSQAELQCEQARERHQRLSEEAREVARKGPGTGASNAKKSESKAELARAEEALKQARAFAEALDRAVDSVERQLHCPTCSQRVDPQSSFEPRVGGHFHCECMGCGTSWGTQACGACEGRFPVLLPRMKNWSAREPEPGWVDQVLGGDVLAVPCARAREPGTFICSACGVCSCAECRKASEGAHVEDAPLAQPAL